MLRCAFLTNFKAEKRVSSLMKRDMVIEKSPACLGTRILFLAGQHLVCRRNASKTHAEHVMMGRPLFLSELLCRRGEIFTGALLPDKVLFCRRHQRWRQRAFYLIIYSKLFSIYSHSSGSNNPLAANSILSVTFF